MAHWSHSRVQIFYIFVDNVHTYTRHQSPFFSRKAILFRRFGNGQYDAKVGFTDFPLLSSSANQPNSVSSSRLTSPKANLINILPRDRFGLTASQGTNFSKGQMTGCNHTGLILQILRRTTAQGIPGEWQLPPLVQALPMHKHRGGCSRLAKFAFPLHIPFTYLSSSFSRARTEGEGCPVPPRLYQFPYHI